MKLQPIQALKGISNWTIAGFLTGAAGFILGFTVDTHFLILGAAACFILPLLRILGVLNDHDEFQLKAAKHAAMVSYIITGLYLFFTLITGQAGYIHWESREIVMNLIPILLMSYYIAYFFQFWDGLKAGRIISWILLLFWGLFTILSSIDEDGGFITFIMQFSATLLPIIIALLLSGKYPLVGGILMAVAFIAHGIHFDAYEQPSVAVMLPVPELVIAFGFFKEFSERRKQKLS